MKKWLLLIALCVGFCGMSHAAAKGSCESEAVSIDFNSSGVARTVTLGAEWFPAEEGVAGYYDTSGVGVYYFKATLKRSYAYTVWTQGITTNDEISVACYAADPKDDDDWGPSADFTEMEDFGGDQRFVLFADDWYIDEEDKSENDPKSWTYYIQITGNVGDQVTINFQSGAIIPPGRVENPRSITPSANRSTVKDILQLDGEYLLRARLQAGRLYYFCTTGGTDTMQLNMLVSGEDDSEGGESSLEMFDDPATVNDPNNTGWYVVPAETGYYEISIDGGSENEQVPFGLVYQMIPSRAIAAHPSTELTAANEFSAEFKAGYMSDTQKGFYDKIIDESLFNFAVVKGQRYLVQTEGAQTNLLMRVYDAKGTLLYENKGDGMTRNVRCAFEATASGTYYVGVCQNLADEFVDVPAYTTARISVSDASPVEESPDAADPLDDTTDGATGLAPLPGKYSDKPLTIDPQGSDWHRLDATDWRDVFVIGARKGLTYQLQVSLEVPGSAFNTLKAEVFTKSGTKEQVVTSTGDINPGSDSPLTFTATVHGVYYVRLSVAEGQGLDYPSYKVHAMAYTTGPDPLGVLTVNTFGTQEGTWTLDAERLAYPGGSSVLVSGTHTLKFGTVKGFTQPVAQKVTVAAGKTPTVVDVYYSDTSDPKDDTVAGATAWSLKNVETSFARTLWKTDEMDTFSLAGKDGNYYDFALKNVTGDAVFSITDATGNVYAENVTSVSQLVLPTSKAKYYLTVKHGTAAKADGSYTLTGFLANVGAIKFAKTAVKAKENAANVAVTVNRTGKDGAVRVKYGTVAGSAQPGVDYVAQSGELLWEAGDNKAKTITIPLIADLVAVYEGDKTFMVKLQPIDEDEKTATEYPATITVDTCTVTLTEVSKAGTTVASTYAAKAPKLATVKTEDVPLASGNFFGVLAEDGCALTNGLPKLASVTFTASAATPSALSAKVALAGKTYTFKDKGWDYEDEETCEKTFELVNKVGTVTYTNTLVVTLAAGKTSGATDWLKAGGEVSLTMNVPDAKGKTVQEEIVYSGTLARENAKIQNYLNVVTNFTGYYTVALQPDSWVGSGVPAGNGYLTLTVDNKGAVKVAGQLADGTTKLSLSAKACAIREASDSANGYAFYIPVFQSKSPYCIGGELRLFQQDDGKVVVDSSKALMWYNDNPALTYDNEEGYQIELAPVGGWYDLVINLQTYYLTSALEVNLADLTEFPTESVANGFVVSLDADPNGLPVSIAADKFATAKKTLVKNGKLVDFTQGSNICNVQVKLARATGLVTGSFSLWSENEDGTAQKEITGLKHSGVLLLSRDAAAPMADDIVSAGFFTQAVTVVDEDPETSKKTNRKWTFSAPFNILGIDQGEPDWWADDWGEQP